MDARWLVVAVQRVMRSIDLVRDCRQQQQAKQKKLILFVLGVLLNPVAFGSLCSGYWFRPPGFILLGVGRNYYEMTERSSMSNLN